MAVDLDGVIWDMLPHWIELYNEVFDDELAVEKIETYDVDRYTKCDKASLMYLLEREDFWDKITISDEVISAIEELQDNTKIDLVVVTATSHRTSLRKLQRLLQLMPFLSENQIIVTARKDLIKADVLIDDWEDNLKYMAKTKQGIPILVTHDYNRSFPNTQYGILRVNSLVDAVEIINEAFQDIE